MSGEAIGKYARRKAKYSTNANGVPRVTVIGVLNCSKKRPEKFAATSAQ